VGTQASSATDPADSAYLEVWVTTFAHRDGDGVSEEESRNGKKEDP
jgi:hypothetical protein